LANDDVANIVLMIVILDHDMIFLSNNNKNWLNKFIMNINIYNWSNIYFSTN
jgi:hypothetical protein